MHTHYLRIVAYDQFGGLEIELRFVPLFFVFDLFK